MNLKEVDDTQLVKQALANKEQFWLIVERWEKPLARYLKRFLTCTNEDVEDLLQEVFIKVFKNLNGYNEKFSFSSWIYKIAHNEAISFWRKTKTRPKVIDVDMELDLDIVENLASELNLEKEFAQKETSGMVREALERGLKANYKEVLVLRYFEDKSYEEMADILQKPMGTIAALVNRAKGKLKAVIQKKDII